MPPRQRRRRACTPSRCAPTRPSSTPSRARPRSPGTRFGRDQLRVRALDEQRTSRTAASSGRPRDSRARPSRVPISLPWITGNPYSLYAHVRARHAPRASTAWSAPFGFNMRWPAVPTPITPGLPGPAPLEHRPRRERATWSGSSTRASGSRRARTWPTSASTTRSTRTRPAAASSTGASGPMRWLYGKTDNALPRSPTAPGARSTRTTTRRSSTGPLQPLATVSNVVSDAIDDARRTRSCPRSSTAATRRSGTRRQELYRVEVFTDEDCLNPVFRGAITGAPAYVPRADRPAGAADRGQRASPARAARSCPTAPEPDSVTLRRPHREEQRVRRLRGADGGDTGLPPGRSSTGARSTSGTATGPAAATTGRSSRSTRYPPRRSRRTLANGTLRGRHHDHRRRRHRHRRRRRPPRRFARRRERGREIDRRQRDHAHLRPQRAPRRRRGRRAARRRRHLPRGRAAPRTPARAADGSASASRASLS